MFLIEVRPGQEVMATAERELERRGIRAGVIVSLIGAVDSCCVSTMPRDDARRDIMREYNEPFELTGGGEIRDGKPHIHCVLGMAGGTAVAGHLHRASVETWFVNVYVEPLTDVT
jgi:predicted DNA-binding protein with PD1-like motif